jgi:hypothetical protein
VVMFVVFAITFTVVACGFVKMKKKSDEIRRQIWREVPPPNWRCRRGGRDYL